MLRELTSKEIDAMLTREKFGHMACCEDGIPYIVPLAFVFDGKAIYGQVMQGKKLDIVRRNPQVCFQVQHVEKNTWRSSQVWGEFEALDLSELDSYELQRITALLSNKIGSIQHVIGMKTHFDFNEEHPIQLNEKGAFLFRIVIREKTGKTIAPKTDSDT